MNFMKMRTFFYKKLPLFIKNCPLLFIKNSIFGNNIHPCSGPSLKFDIKCVFMWSHLWAGVVRVGHCRAFRNQSTCSALLLVLPCNQGECSDDYGDCGDHDGDSGDNNDDLGMMVMSEVKTD